MRVGSGWRGIRVPSGGRVGPSVDLHTLPGSCLYIVPAVSTAVLCAVVCAVEHPVGYPLPTGARNFSDLSPVPVPGYPVFQAHIPG